MQEACAQLQAASFRAGSCCQTRLLKTVSIPLCSMPRLHNSHWSASLPQLQPCHVSICPCLDPDRITSFRIKIESGDLGTNIGANLLNSFYLPNISSEQGYARQHIHLPAPQFHAVSMLAIALAPSMLISMPGHHGNYSIDANVPSSLQVKQAKQLMVCSGDALRLPGWQGP